ncbi:cytochrome P450 [Xylaria longipes]|nr:cytochrome P450 [Xylaria longipes]
MLGSTSDPTTTMLAICLAFGLALVMIYVHDTVIYHRSNTQSEQNQVPPKYPTLIPYLGNIFPFLLDCPSFIQRATSYAGQLTSSRIAAAPGLNVYLFQDRETIKRIWKKSAVMCAGRVHVYACKYMFGMPEKSLALYAADNSGPFPKPYPGSNVLPQNRIHRILNDGIEAALTGPGFDPTLQRFRKAFMLQISQLKIHEEWIEVSDFRKFVHETVGSSLLQAIFGPGLLLVNPNLVDDLFEFDQALPWLAKGLPAIFLPKPYAVRRRLHSAFKSWYAYARKHFSEEQISEDGDGDPSWGSAWMRHRQQTLGQIKDEDTLAAGDLGVAWASIANVVSASTLALVHVAEESDLALRMQEEVRSEFDGQSLADIDLKKLTSNPFLSSIYAETLRLHVKSFTIASAPLQDVPLGRFILPKGDLGLINSYISHMDDTFWNTRNGCHPLQEFWAERFLIDPADPTSGPSKTTHRQQPRDQSTNGKPFFSLKGLEGSWIPYGGGQLICPGRFLAKSVMIFTCILLLREFDIEILTREIRFSTRSFGFGTEIPNHPIRVRMRRR